MVELVREPVAASRWTGPQHLMSPPPPELVLELQAPTAYPAVTILMPTAPAATMSAEDAARLRGLLDHAKARLAGDPAPGGDVVRALTGLVTEASRLPTATALAIFASADGIRASVRLPVAVTARTVVDATFATRDLVRAVHRTPRHAVLVLGLREARLFVGAGDELTPAGRPFPMSQPRERGRDHARAGRAQALTAAFCRQVDAALGAHLALHPSPVVLAGSQRAVAAFREQSRHLSRLAGVVPANLVREPLSSLVQRVRPVLDAYLRSRQEEALALLERRVGARAAVSGIEAAWLAARHELPEMLVVEETLTMPARLSADGDRVERAFDVEAPDVVDDLVDELIEVVLRRGGWVALAEPGALAPHDGVALTLRSPGRSAR